MLINSGCSLKNGHLPLSSLAAPNHSVALADKIMALTVQQITSLKLRNTV